MEGCTQPEVDDISKLPYLAINRRMCVKPMLPSGSGATMLLKEATLCKTRVALHDYGLRLSSFPHPKATLRVQRKR